MGWSVLVIVQGDLLVQIELCHSGRAKEGFCHGDFGVWILFIHSGVCVFGLRKPEFLESVLPWQAGKCWPSCILRSDHNHIHGEWACPILRQEMLFLNSAAKVLLHCGAPGRWVLAVWEFWAGEEELLTHFLGQFSLYPLCFAVKHQGRNRALL